MSGKLIPLTQSHMVTLVTVCAITPAVRETIAGMLTDAGMLVADPAPPTLCDAIAADLAATGPAATAKAAAEQAEPSPAEQAAPVTITVRGKPVEIIPRTGRGIWTWQARGSAKYGVRVGICTHDPESYVMRAYSEKSGKAQGGAFLLAAPAGYRQIGVLSEPIAPPSPAEQAGAAADGVRMAKLADKANAKQEARDASDMLAEGKLVGASVADQLAPHCYQPAKGQPAEPFHLVLVDPAARVIVRRKSDGFPVVFLSDSRKGKQALNGTHPRYKGTPSLLPVAVEPIDG